MSTLEHPVEIHRGKHLEELKPHPPIRLLTEPHLNPLQVISEDVLCKITGFLDAQSLLKLREVNRGYRRIASLSEAGWDNLCQVLWKDKIHISPQALREENRMFAYRLSLQDARERNHMTISELCYDEELGKGTVWSFRFKESAGTDWTSVDPWYSGLPSRNFVFLQDGTVRQYIANERPVLRTPNFSTTDPTELGVTVTGPRLVTPPMPMTWRFLTRPLDLPSRPLGSYIRFSVGGRDVPTYAVRRSPTGNWGFVMESCWGLYASFELPPRRISNRRRRLRRTEEGGAIWVDADDDSDESDDIVGQLQDDSSMVITNEIQWREAFLYNVGARVLPDGDEATDEFDRAWQGL